MSGIEGCVLGPNQYLSQRQSPDHPLPHCPLHAQDSGIPHCLIQGWEDYVQPIVSSSWPHLSVEAETQAYHILLCKTKVHVSEWLKPLSVSLSFSGLRPASIPLSSIRLRSMPTLLTTVRHLQGFCCLFKLHKLSLVFHIFYLRSLIHVAGPPISGFRLRFQAMVLSLVSCFLPSYRSLQGGFLGFIAQYLEHDTPHFLVCCACEDFAMWGSRSVLLGTL